MIRKVDYWPDLSKIEGSSEQSSSGVDRTYVVVNKEDIVEDDTIQAENTQVAEDSYQDTSPVDETNTSVEQETDGNSEDTQVNESEAEDTSEAERKPTRAEQRIRELNSKVKQLEQTNQQFQGYQPAPQYQTNEDGEITVDALQRTTA